MKKRHLLFLSAVIFLTLTLWGCGGSSNQVVTTDTVTDTVGEPEA